MNPLVFRRVFISSLCLAVISPLAGAAEVSGVVPASWPAGVAAPLAVPLPDDVPNGPLDVTLLIRGCSAPFTATAQIEPASAAANTPRRAWLMINLPEQARKQRVTAVFEASRGAGSSAYDMHYQEPELFVDTPDGSRILGYWHGEPETGKRYALTDFIHPVVGLDGEFLTSSRAEDHPHHRGVFWPWVRYERHGRSIGQWWIPDRMAMESGELDYDDGPVLAWFAGHHWLTSSAAGESKRVIDQWTVCRVFETTPVGRAIDIEIMQKALEPGIAIGGQTALKKGYGGFTVRFAQAEDVQIVADGTRLLVQDRNEVEAAWTDYSGRFVGPDGRRLDHPSGAAILVHGSHPEWPTYWITRRYGPMGVCYPGLQMAELPTEDFLRLRYRLWIHRGRAPEAHVQQQFDAYLADWGWEQPNGHTKTTNAREP